MAKFILARELELKVERAMFQAEQMRSWRQDAVGPIGYDTSRLVLGKAGPGGTLAIA